MDPKQCLNNFVTGVPFRYTCYRISNHRIPLLRAYSGLPRAYLANEQIIGLHCFGPTRAYLGPTLPTSQSVNYIASGLLRPTSGLPCQPANHWISLLWAYWAYLGPTLPTANEKIIGNHCFGPTGPTSGLPCQPRARKSLAVEHNSIEDK